MHVDVCVCIVFGFVSACLTNIRSLPHIEVAVPLSDFTTELTSLVPIRVASWTLWCVCLYLLMLAGACEPNVHTHAAHLDGAWFSTHGEAMYNRKRVPSSSTHRAQAEQPRLKDSVAKASKREIWEDCQVHINPLKNLEPNPPAPNFQTHKPYMTCV